MKARFTTILLALGVFFPAAAQDNHYEGLLMGSKNAILSGAAVSKWLDQTAVVVNAATMMSAQEQGFTFNSTAGSYDKIYISDAFGEGLDLSSDDFYLYPGLVAADLPVLKNQQKNRLGIAIFSRLADRTRFAGNTTGVQNIVNDAEAPGAETYLGQYVLDIELKETTGALAWSRRISDHLSTGLTLMAIFRNHRYREGFDINILPQPENNPAVDLVSVESDISLKMNVNMAQLRGSLAWNQGPWSAGLVLTLPSIRLWSSGNMLAEASLVNIKPAPDSTRNSYFLSVHQEKQRPVFKYPMSVTAGVSRQVDNAVLYVACSWYSALDRYVVMAPANEPILYPPNAENIAYSKQALEVWSSNRSLFNLLFSTEWNAKPNLAVMGGFRTDLHYAQFPDPEPAGFQLPKKIWNRYHVNVGVALQNKFSRWIIGFEGTWGGAEDYRQPFSFDGISDIPPFEGKAGNSDVRQFGLTGNISFLFFVNRDKEQNKE